MDRCGCLKRAFTHRSKTVSIEKRDTAASPVTKPSLATLAGYFAQTVDVPWDMKGVTGSLAIMQRILRPAAAAVGSPMNAKKVSGRSGGLKIDWAKPP
jgi:hypothetical protein